MSKVPISLFMAPGDEGLKDYLKKVHAYPLLSSEEEHDLVQQWASTQDAKAMERLVSSHLRLVTKIAAGYRGYGMSYADLIAEGNIGILQALKRFDPEKGVRFSTYARWWVQAAIQEYVLRSWSLVKTGTNAAQKKLFFNLRRVKHQLGILDNRTLTPEIVREISEELEVPEKEVLNMNERMTYQDSSLNTKISTDGSSLEWQDWLEDGVESHEDTIIDDDEKVKHKALLNECLGLLTERERDIFIDRRLLEPPKTLEIIADSLHLSKERVRQIEVMAFKKIQDKMVSAAHDKGWFA